MSSNQIELITVLPVIGVFLIWIITGNCTFNLSPWINSCIGFYNRKAFILMLFYTTVMTILNVLITLLSISPLTEKSQS